jgi:glycosyltransferase involved in cell wall biosynthesis
MADFTICVVARNAGATIARAVRSAVAERPASILIVDDRSEDATVQRALEAGGALVTVHRLELHRTVGFARQAALDAVRTPFGVWLDADDELLPGRCARLLASLNEHAADVAFDAAQVVPGNGGDAAVASIPAFLHRPPGAVRLFERLYVPAPGAFGFRTWSVRQIGYDAALHGAEDADIVLRALAAGVRLSFVEAVGYRLHASPRSLSRDLANQRQMYARALRKHDYARVQRLFADHGARDEITLWALVSIAAFREEWPTALAFLELAARTMTDPAVVLEPDGPCPRPEGWRLAFHRGTFRLLLGSPHAAVASLEDARRYARTPEDLNNLGVALARLGDRARARACFEEALDLLPHYVDARVNVASVAPERVTTHPLRADPPRADYRAP